jgi:hypothetical protein
MSFTASRIAPASGDDESLRGVRLVGDVAGGDVIG